MAKAYFTLLARDHKNEPWTPQFGDYDREVVEQERDDQKDSETFQFFKIIKTAPDQASIDAEVAKINANEGLQAHAEESDMGSAPKTNVELITSMMEFSDYGALAQGFIVDAITKFSNAVASKPLDELRKQMADSPVTAEAWHGVAAEIKRKMDQFYDRSKSC